MHGKAVATTAWICVVHTVCRWWGSVQPRSRNPTTQNPIGNVCFSTHFEISRILHANSRLNSNFYTIVTYMSPPAQ
jgi:hypothetical protein